MGKIGFFCVLILIFFGIPMLLVFIAIYIREIMLHPEFRVNMLFSIFVIPIYLALITNIFTLWKGVSVNKWILFIYSIFSILVGISIIFIRYSGFLFWKTIIGLDPDGTLIAPYLIIFSIISYFAVYFIINVIIKIICKIKFN